jgi:hypothetical protein
MAETKSFINYIAEAKKEYRYLLKFAVNDMTDSMIDRLESCLTKYELKSASSFRKTPIQESPLDFPNVKNTPVFTCDLVLGYPAALDFLRTYICNNLAISPALLAVYSENDPRQIETDLFVERTSPEYREKYKSRLATELEATESPAYGEKYNVEFLKELDRVSKERNVVTVENPLSPAAKTEAVPAGYDSFNDAKNMKKDDVGLFGRVKKSPLVKVGKL